MRALLLTLGLLQGVASAAVVTVTAADEVMHVGEAAPPLTFRVTGGYKAQSCTGSPALTTSAGSSSAAGTYSITASAGTLACPGNTFSFVAGTMTVLSGTEGVAGDRVGAKITAPSAKPSGFMTTVQQWATTVGVSVSTDCTTDNSAAINAILHYNRASGADYYENHRGIFFPTGCYALSAPLTAWGNALTIRFDAGAKFYVLPNSSAFNGGTRTSVFAFDSYGGNSSFRNFAYNPVIEVGPGNPKAMGMTYVGNNSGGVFGGRFICDDGECPVGLEGIAASGPTGPVFFENVETIGFQKGFEFGSGGYSVSMEGITAQACTDSGITSVSQPLAMRHALTWCANSAPGSNFGASNYAVFNSLFGNGNEASYGNYTHDGGTIRVRDTSCAGYGVCLNDNGTTSATPIAEHYSGTAATLFSSAKSPTALKLVPPTIPTVIDPAVGSWSALGTDLSTWQTTLNSGASTVYAPFGNYTSGAGTSSAVVYTSNITNCALNHIYLNDTTAGQPGYGGQTVTQLNLNFASNCSGVPLIIEGLGSYAKITNNSARTLEMRDGIPTNYTNGSGAGDVFKLNVQVLQGTVTWGHGQHVWSWQDDSEPVGIAHDIVDGAGTTFWGFLRKTEQPGNTSGSNLGEVFTCQNSAKCELPSTMLFAVNQASPDGAAVGCYSANCSFSLFQYVEGSQNGVWPHLVRASNGTTTSTYTPSTGAVAYNQGLYYDDTTPTAAPGGDVHTWYLRADGGTPLQCTGHYDAAYPGSGLAQPCAIKDWRQLYDSSSYDSSNYNHLQWLIAGGDAVILDNGNAWSVGMDASSPSSSTQCHGLSAGAVGCNNPPIPAGVAGAPTRILGRNFASCSNADGTPNHSAMSKMVGRYSVQTLISAVDTSNVEIQCLELTQTSDCQYARGYDSGSGYVNLNTSALCNADSSGGNPLTDFGQSGIFTSKQTTQLLLKNLWIHALVNRGILGGIGPRIKGVSLDIEVNGSAGWDLDDGRGNGPHASVQLSHVRIDRSGCFPTTSGAVKSCYDQSTGAYADSFAAAEASQFDLYIDHSTFRWNGEDAPDTVHSDTGSNGFMFWSNSRSEGNTGAAGKWGPQFRYAFLRNNVFIANCARGQAAFTGLPSNYNAGLRLVCRAQNALGGGVYPNGNIFFQRNTVMTAAPTTYDASCGVRNDCTSSKTNTDHNIFVGYADPATYNGGGANSGPGMYCGFGCDSSTVAMGTWVRDSNLYWGVRQNQANVVLGMGSPETATNEVFANPNFVSQPNGTDTTWNAAQLDNFNPVLPSGSAYAGWGANTAQIASTAAPTLRTIYVLPYEPIILHLGSSDRYLNIAGDYSDDSGAPLDDALCTSSDTSKVTILRDPTTNACIVHAVALTSSAVTVAVAHAGVPSVNIVVTVEPGALVSTGFSGSALTSQWNNDQNAFSVDTQGAWNPGNIDNNSPLRYRRARYTNTALPADGMTCTRASVLDGSFGIGPLARATLTGGQYRGYVVNASGFSTDLYREASDGTRTLFGDGNSPLPGEELCLRHVGNQISLYLNGVKTLGPITDTTYTAAGSGMWADSTGNYRNPPALENGTHVSNFAFYPITASASQANIAPQITTQPQSQTVAAGSPFAFTTAVTGSPAPNCQWYEQSAAITGATSCSGYSGTASISQAGHVFTMVATNGVAADANSSPATLTVSFTPNGWYTEPLSSESALNANWTGTPSAFTVVGGLLSHLGSGAEIVRLTGSSVPLAPDAGMCVTVSSTGSSDILAPMVRVDSTFSGYAAFIQNGTATVWKVANGGGAGTINSAVGVANGDLICLVGSGSSIILYKNGTAVQTSSDSTYPAATGSVPGLLGYLQGSTKFSSAQAGPLTSGSSNTAPVVSAQPVSQSVTAGATATFSSAATGTPTPSVQWYRSGSPIAGATSSTYTTGTLSTADSGSAFYAVWTNSAGTSQSSTATLTVNAAAPTLTSITVAPSTSAIATGGTATLITTAHYSDGSSAAVAASYASSNTAVATVGASSGVMTAVGTGTAVITATYMGQTATATVTVSATMSISTQIQGTIKLQGVRIQ